MTKKYSDIYADGTYLKNNPGWDAEDSLFKAGKILKLLKNHKLSIESVCEIGCGSGEILVQLSSKLPSNIKFLGVDVSPDAINIAGKKATSQIQFELKDITTEKTLRHFDLVLIMDVIEHVENYFQFLRDIFPMSRYTIFHIPIDLSLWTLLREKMLIESKERVGHIHNFTEDFVKSILTDCGYKIIDQIYTEPNFKPVTIKQKFIEFIRRILFKINPRFCSKTIGGISILILTENNYQPGMHG